MLIEPDWGHPLIGLSGEVLRVPRFVYDQLHQLGVKKRYSIHLSPAIYEMLDPKYDTLTNGLRRLIGSKLDGPAWLVCTCEECRRRESQTDNTEMPGRSRSELAADIAISDMRHHVPVAETRRSRRR